jgi:hypothetical protein
MKPFVDPVLPISAVLVVSFSCRRSTSFALDCSADISSWALVRTVL